MSTPEQTQESKSSVKVVMNAKGMAQPEVKVYEGMTETEMARIATLALDTFNSVVNRLGSRANFS